MREDSRDFVDASINRRAAIKAAFGVTAGAVVWAEPTIRGVARRPAYAAAGSAGGTVTFNYPLGVQYDFSANNVLMLTGDDGTSVLTITHDPGLESVTFDITTPTDAGFNLTGSAIWAGNSQLTTAGADGFSTLFANSTDPAVRGFPLLLNSMTFTCT